MSYAIETLKKELTNLDVLILELESKKVGFNRQRLILEKLKRIDVQVAIQKMKPGNYTESQVDNAYDKGYQDGCRAAANDISSRV